MGVGVVGGNASLGEQVFLPLAEVQWLTDMPGGALEVLVYGPGREPRQLEPIVEAVRSAAGLEGTEVEAWYQREPWLSVMAMMDGIQGFIQFFIILLDRMGIDDIDPARQYDPACWPRIRERLTEAFAQRTRDEWVDLLEGEDACCTPVLSPTELAGHPHLRQRSAMVEVDGLEQPTPAPRFSRTPAEVRHGPAHREPREEVLERWGVIG